MASGHVNRTNRSHEGGASKISCRPSQTGDLSMSPTIAARSPAAVDYERTLILSIEVSNQNWVLAAQVPGLPHTKAKCTVDPEAEALMAAIAGYRSRAAEKRDELASLHRKPSGRGRHPSISLKKPCCASQHFGPPDFRNGSKAERLAVSIFSPAYPHVWTAPSWQGESSRRRLVGAAMCSACWCGSHDRWP